MMLTGKYLTLYTKISKQVDKNRIFHDPMHTLAFGTDASFYRFIPKMVIKTKNESEMSLILQECSHLDLPVTFRAAGTSLSGQAITDSVLLVAAEHWKNYSISEDASTITLQPGLTGGYINSLLAPFGRKIGPDPASIDAATIGGIVANNASGMRSGTGENAYNTVESLRIILADGTVLDTGDESNKAAFLSSHKKFIEDLLALAKSVKANIPMSDKIRNKYLLKNTTGYNLNGFIDLTDPFQLIKHLLTGSEGTLGFISQIKLRTVIEHPFKASSFMVFPDTDKAFKAVALLRSAPVSAAEFIDRAGLSAVEDEAGMPGFLKNLSPGASALLVETVSDQQDELQTNIEIILKMISPVPVEIPITFTAIPGEYAAYWNIRKGLFPSVGAKRKSGTTVIIEDVAFPPDRLADATSDLRLLLKKYDYDDAVIYGHALEGNLHFIFSQDFGIKEETEKYKNLMVEISDLVINKYDGSLKAEHGTGLNMAPFVEKEWGEEAFSVMKNIKHIFDPKNILNPGVILNSDPEIHLKNFKNMHPADESIDKCIECGFCEPSCVSADLTLTPRQRIVVFRELSHLRKTGQQPHIISSLVRSFDYAGNQTCATDGLCASKCPVKIDTGILIKKLRAENIANRHRVATWIAGHMNIITAIGRKGLSFVSLLHSILGSCLMKGITGTIRKLSGNKIPLWTPNMPGGAKRINFQNTSKRQSSLKAVYFPSCINRSMGTSKDHKEEVQLTEKMVSLMNKGGYEVIFPENLNNLCCGMAFLSKGFKEAGEKKSQELESALLKASKNGKYPVICDMSPCLYTMKENFTSGLKLYEPVEFITSLLLPHLNISPVNESVTVFPVCSIKKMGLTDKLVELAKKCAVNVTVTDTNCCGFAGDRGFTYPELNRYGLRNLKKQIPVEVKHGYSTSRTCEIGLSFHSGISYKSIIYLVDKVTTPK